MIRTLTLIAVTGFALSLACLSTAVAIAGPDFVSRGAWAWGAHRDNFGDSGEAVGGPEATRQFAWDDSRTLSVSIPAEIRYVQAPGPARLNITGPTGLLDRIEVKDGAIHFRDGPFRSRGQRLRIELSAPNVRGFDIAGASELTVENYNQPELKLDMSGSGEARISGRAQTARVDISGSAEADLADLQVQGAEVDISGSGEARIAPTQWAEMDIAGSGQVDLLTNPPQVETDISGSGRVNRSGPRAVPAPPAPPQAPRAT